MPVSVSTTPRQAVSADILSAAKVPSGAAFGVVSFRRDASGAIVANTAVAVPNCDIAWRRARAEAFEHGNIGAVVLAATPVGAQGGSLCAGFGEFDLGALTH